jgi:hypothetical protein
MGFWDSVFGSHSQPAPVSASRQLPSSLVAKEFGEVNIRRNRSSQEVTFTILMEPSGEEGWQTGVAIDASGSMKGVFGKELGEAGPQGKPPKQLIEKYTATGWLQLVKHQGREFSVLRDEAKADLVDRGHYRWTANEIEPLARKLTAYLASNLDADGGTTVIYWACGDGTSIEVVGDLTREDCERQTFNGPTGVQFGTSTALTPAVRYFAERFSDAKNGMYIFLTDGELSDLQTVKRYTTQLCREMMEGRRNPFKCVLVGMGDGIDETQMEELDDLDSGTTIDIWDHKIAREMRDLIEIFAEVVSENQIVAPTAKIYDASGTVVKHFTDGLPAKASFSLPASSPYFELEVGDQRIRQVLA